MTDETIEIRDIMGAITESQTEQILHYLKMGRHLTPMAALRLFGCFRLAARIHELRGRSLDVHMRQRLIGGKHVAEYYL